MVFATFFTVLTDTSTLLALTTVFFVDVYSAYRAHENSIRSKLLGVQHRASTSPTERFVATHGHSLDGPWIWGLPVIAACTLLLMFFLLPYLGAILLLFSSLSCCVAIIFVLLPLGTYITRRISLPFLQSNEDNDDEIAAALVSPIAIIIVLYWLVSGNYIANNILGIALCIMFGAVCRVQSFRSLVVLMSGLFMYDVFFVFFSDRFFSKNVMVEVATSSSNNPANTIASWLHLPFSPVKNLSIPAKLIFPSSDGTYTILGLGDIVLAELLLIFLIKQDLQLDFVLWNGLFVHALGAHIVALFISFYCNSAFQAAQPALFYIVPLTLGVTAFLAKKKNVLSILWNDSTPATQSYRELQNSSPEEGESIIDSKNDDESMAV